MRGGDFILTVGGDLAVGYRSHDRDALHLFCVETLAPQTLEPTRCACWEVTART